MRKTLKVVMTAGALGLSALAFAGDTPAGAASAKSGSEALHQKMMQGAKDMQAMPMSGDVDHDFITMMRKHHQDGIAMAEIELKQGKDPQAKELARRIRDSQKKDLADFERWLSQHQQGTGGGGTQGTSGETP
ncbi:DUF305 domain-containing protein [Pyxidicoccus sp. 3LFB2]